MGEKEPQLTKSEALDPNDIGTFEYLPSDTSCLRFTNNNTTVEWVDHYSASWIPIETKSLLHNGKFSFDFLIEKMGKKQIGIGFMLNWDLLGPDWGFYGYLGSSSSAFSYDPSTGDIVTSTESIHGGLPVLEDGNGIVSLELDLPPGAPNTATFIVKGTRCPVIRLPPSCVCVPAVCLLGRLQKVTIKNFRRLVSN